MRLKKKVLLAGESEEHISLLSFLLRTNRYEVVAAASADEARKQLRAQQFDLLLCRLPLAGIEAVFEEARTSGCFNWKLVMGAGSEEELSKTYPDGFLRDSISSFELLERVKVMCTRKRGPRSTKRHPHGESPVLEVRLAADARGRLA